MKILAIEDDVARHDVFKDKYKNHDLIISSNYFDAIGRLSSERFDLVLLDKDLSFDKSNSFFNGVANQEKTGWDVVYWMIGHLPKENKPGLVVVHTNSELDGPKMAAALNNYGIRAKYENFKPESEPIQEYVLVVVQ